ncbi:Protochlorophyllide-dependent translocon component 52, chloroplastic [Vitis vinifera]|uniref:Protochlorophyllide-dependent translocon component 52, chloroplastic n=1 Tax=Vitis vinifera TaxID=29760 RepID=A0A438EM54_VITVI|nr:Protochlorophyllide-dependent translocon component 52, chloroplastic [Vitis vinifera]
MVLDVVVWWDRNESEWKVFDDAVLIAFDKVSRFTHSRKHMQLFIQVLCRMELSWFWPNTDPQFKDIIMKKRPPYIPELDDLSYTKSMGARDFPFGVVACQEQIYSTLCVLYLFGFLAYQSNESVSSGLTKEEPSSHVSPKSALLFLICVPVSPGNSRLIWTSPRNFGLWTDQVTPVCLYCYFLPRSLRLGPSNWHKPCFFQQSQMPHIVAFRAWLRKYSGGQLDRGTEFNRALFQLLPREQLMDRYDLNFRYWSHVVKCSRCSVHTKWLQGLHWYPWQPYALQLQGACLSSSTHMPSADTSVSLAIQKIEHHIALYGTVRLSTEKNNGGLCTDKCAVPANLFGLLEVSGRRHHSRNGPDSAESYEVIVYLALEGDVPRIRTRDLNLDSCPPGTI